MISLSEFRIKFKFTHVQEGWQFYDFLIRNTNTLTDEGTDCFIKREMLKLLKRLEKKLTFKSLRLTITWYEYQAIKYLFEFFEVPDSEILAKVAYGKIDQALPIGLGGINA